jgi:hypothetical protein
MSSACVISCLHCWTVMLGYGLTEPVHACVETGYELVTRTASIIAWMMVVLMTSQWIIGIAQTFQRFYATWIINKGVWVGDFWWKLIFCRYVVTLGMWSSIAWMMVVLLTSQCFLRFDHTLVSFLEESIMVAGLWVIDSRCSLIFDQNVVSEELWCNIAHMMVVILT